MEKSGIAQLATFQRNGIVQSKIAQSEIRNGWPFMLSWTHYQVLMRIENVDERSFYEKEAYSQCWDVKTLKRQYHSSLYERLALSRNKTEVLRLANEGSTPYNQCKIRIYNMRLLHDRVAAFLRIPVRQPMDLKFN